LTFQVPSRTLATFVHDASLEITYGCLPPETALATLSFPWLRRLVGGNL